MGAATLRRGEQVVLLPKTLPSVSGAEHQRALTDLRREMDLKLSKAKKESGFTQEDLDRAVSEAVTKAVNETVAANESAPAAVPEPDSTPEAPAEHPTQGMNAVDAIEHIQGLDTVEDVEAVIASENDGKGRKSVLRACAEHIKWLNEPD